MGLLDNLGGVNLNKVFEMAQKEYSQLTFKLKSCDKDRLEFTGDIVAEKYFDDSVWLKCVCYASGCIHVFLVFDKLDADTENYRLINEFNCNSSFLRGYINNNGYFEIHYSAIDLKSNKLLTDSFVFALNQLLSDNTLQYLKPITYNTYSNNN